MLHNMYSNYTFEFENDVPVYITDSNFFALSDNHVFQLQAKNAWLPQRKVFFVWLLYLRIELFWKTIL